MWRRLFSSSLPTSAKAVMAKGLPKKLAITGIDNVIIISSAKGGVGKSTVAVNLAIALSRIDISRKIGLLDCDIYGPSIPQLMGIDGIQPDSNERGEIIPIQNYGIACMSFGSLVKKDSAIIWRGLMVMRAVQTLLRQVTWGDLNTLVIDTPPGTGDVHLSLSQNIPIKGSIVVTTSHKLDLSDTQRGIEMLLKLNIPLLGLVENMAEFICPNCSFSTHLWHSTNITEKSAAAKLADQYEVPLLCQLPIEPVVSIGNEKGMPVVISHPGSHAAITFMQLAKRVHNLLQVNTCAHS